MKQFCRWFRLCCKRLYRSFAFWGVIVLMLVASITFSYISKMEPTVARILLVQHNPEDAVTKSIVTNLMESRETISFALEFDVNIAKEQVKYGKVDAVWIFPEDMSDALQSFSENTDPNSKIVIFQREDTVIMRLARERLSTSVYQCASQYVYLRFLQENVPSSQNVSNEVLLQYWHETSVSGALFDFTDIHGTPEPSDNTFLQPFLGVLAILGTMLSVIISLGFQKDLDTGKYAVISQKKCIVAEFCHQLAASLHYGFAMMIVMCVFNNKLFLIEEAVRVLVFILTTSLFGMFIRSVMGGRRLMMVLMPVLVILMMLACPIFIAFRQQEILKWLFPPTYFLLSVHDVSAVLLGILYCVIVILLGLCVRLFKSKVSNAAFV